MAKTKRKQHHQQERKISTKQINLALEVYKADAFVKQQPPLTGPLLAGAQEKLERAILELVKACNFEKEQYQLAMQAGRLIIEARANELAGEQEAKRYGAHLD